MGIIKFNIEQNEFFKYSNLNGLQIIEYSDGAYLPWDEEFDNIYSGIYYGFGGYLEETGNSSASIFLAFSLTIWWLLVRRKKYIRLLTIEWKIRQRAITMSFFSISFTALDYVNGNNYTYYYKLDDLSKQWIDNGTSNVFRLQVYRRENTHCL